MTHYVIANAETGNTLNFEYELFGVWCTIPAFFFTEQNALDMLYKLESTEQIPRGIYSVYTIVMIVIPASNQLEREKEHEESDTRSSTDA